MDGESHSHHLSKRQCRAMGEADAEDRLSGLPKDLLHSILRGLQLKHAARTSALSRRWAHLWLGALACSPVLDFTDRDFARRQPPARAAATVSHCLWLHEEQGATLDVFRVALVFPSLGGDGAFGRRVVGWVAAALRRGAREVEADLMTPMLGTPTAFLELPGGLFLATNSLERLALGGFSLRAVAPGAPGLAGLRSLSLSRAADVTDEAVRDVLANCQLLEFLSLKNCPLLTSVRIAGDRLRGLELVGCRGVRELCVAAPALESFVYCGHAYLSGGTDEDYADVVELDDGTAMPALRDAYLSHLGHGEYPDNYDLVNPFLYYVAHARILTLCSVSLLQTYDETAYSDMPNLRELQLLMASLEDDDLDHVSQFFMLTELPLLDRLFVRLPGHDTADASGAVAAQDNADIVLDYEVVLDQLTLIKMVKFRGTRRELRLLRFLLNRAPLLEQLVLVTLEEEGATGDERLKLIQGRVSAMWKASPEARVTVCRSSEDRSANPAHTRLYHEE